MTEKNERVRLTKTRQQRRMGLCERTGVSDKRLRGESKDKAEGTPAPLDASAARGLKPPLSKLEVDREHRKQTDLPGKCYDDTYNYRKEI